MSDHAELTALSVVEWREAERELLCAVGCSRAELAQMARNDSFSTTAQRKAWLMMGHLPTGRDPEGR